ncbi:hypothetical protein AB1N83_011063 [Pleurotus pulmonarius]
MAEAYIRSEMHLNLMWKVSSSQAQGWASGYQIGIAGGFPVSTRRITKLFLAWRRSLPYPTSQAPLSAPYSSLRGLRFVVRIYKSHQRWRRMRDENHHPHIPKSR